MRQAVRRRTSRRHGGALAKEDVRVVGSVVQELLGDGNRDVRLVVGHGGGEGHILSLVEERVVGNAAVLFGVRTVHEDGLRLTIRNGLYAEITVLQNGLVLNALLSLLQRHHALEQTHRGRDGIGGRSVGLLHLCFECFVIVVNYGSRAFGLFRGHERTHEASDQKEDQEHRHEVHLRLLLLLLGLLLLIGHSGSRLVTNKEQTSLQNGLVKWNRRDWGEFGADSCTAAD